MQAEEEERRAKEAIEQHRQELQQIEEQRQKEVRSLPWLLVICPLNTVSFKQALRGLSRRNLAPTTCVYQ